MNKLIHRACPNCEGDDPILMFELSLDQFFKSNPTYNQKWFDSLNFPKEKKFKFVRCSICNFVYSESRLNDRLNSQFYNIGIDAHKSLKKIFSTEKKLRQISIWYNLLSLYTTLSELPADFSKKKLKVMDFGAGWGDFLALVQSPGIDVFGLEFSNDKIAYANTKGVPVGDFGFIENNAPYDIFICNQVLEHLDKPKDSLKSIKKLLKKSAIGFISVPNFSPKRLDQCVRDMNRGKAVVKEINPWGHLNYFAPQTLRKMLIDSGFSIINSTLQVKIDSKETQDNLKNQSSFRNNLYSRFKALFTFFDMAKNAKTTSTQRSTSVFVKISVD